MSTHLNGILGNKPIPAGGRGRALTALEAKRLRVAGHTAGRNDFVMQYGAGDSTGVLYRPAKSGGHYNSGLVLHQ